METLTEIGARQALTFLHEAVHDLQLVQLAFALQVVNRADGGMEFGSQHVDELGVVQQVHHDAREQTGDGVDGDGHEVELTVHNVKLFGLTAVPGVLLGPAQTAALVLGRQVLLLAEAEGFVLEGPLLDKPLDLEILPPDLTRRGQEPVRDRAQDGRKQEEMFPSLRAVGDVRICNADPLLIVRLPLGVHHVSVKHSSLMESGCSTSTHVNED